MDICLPSAPRPGIEPANFRCEGRRPTQLSRGQSLFLRYPLFLNDCIICYNYSPALPAAAREEKGEHQRPPGAGPADRARGRWASEHIYFLTPCCWCHLLLRGALGCDRVASPAPPPAPEGGGQRQQ